MKEAECKECGAIYILHSEKVPKAMKCTCESKEFKLIKEKE